MSGEKEEQIEEFQDQLFIRWKIDIMHHKVHKFIFRGSKFTLIFQPTICNSMLFVFLHGKSSSDAYQVNTRIENANRQEVCWKHYKGPVAHKPVIWSYDREELMSRSGISLTPQILVFCFQIGSVNSDAAVQGISKKCFRSEASDAGRIINDKLPQELPLKTFSDDICQLYNSMEHSDVIVNNGEQTIRAHKNILSARSEVFAEMFRNKMESKNGVVNITNIKPEVLNKFIQYIYTGETEISLESACMLYEVADRYAVDHLKKLCGSYLVKNLKIANACDVMMLAETHSDEDLRKPVMRFMIKASGFFQSDQWAKFSNENPILAIKVYKKFLRR